jgi:hypothetical protein
MPETRAHKTTANRIARKYKTEYNEGPGANIQTSLIAIEVELPESVSVAMAQLQRYRKPVYIAETNKEAVEKALEVTQAFKRSMSV